MRKILVFLVRAYQVTLSPFLGKNCRHEPTCSAYAIEAINTWGAVKGLGLAIRRIIKCNPWGTSGYDPVPKHPE